MSDDLATRDRSNIKRLVSELEDAILNLEASYDDPEGKFEEARQAYEKALKLDPKNLLIRQNYDLFKEINDRTKRRSGK